MKSLFSMSMVLSLVLSIAAFGDEKSDEVQRAAHLARMKSIAVKFEVDVGEGTAPTAAKIGETPLLRYNDATRRLNESALWLWTDRERPIALMAIEYYANERNAPPWLFEIVSLSTSKIRVARGGEWKWQAKQSGVVRKPVPGDLVPADKPVLRLTQARLIRQRFAAHEKANIGGRIELRPLSNPLYRYADEQTGVIDGAIFAFANGTNPEVLLILEAQRDAATKQAIWTYGFAQMTGAAVYASLDDREVWSQKEADPPAIRDSYVNDWLKDEGTEPQK